MSNSEILEMFKCIVPFIAQVCGPSCEVVLHDLADTSQSVIAIENGDNSGRTIGCPITDLAQKIIDGGEHTTKDFLVNYYGFAKGKKFISSTYFIKNNNKLIGLLCVNRDTSSIAALDNALEFFKKQNNLCLTAADAQENLDTPVASILQNLVNNTIADTGLVPTHMSRDDKVNIVLKLQEQGVTKMKGAVSEIAAQLNISEPTVYRYMSKHI